MTLMYHTGIREKSNIRLFTCLTSARQPRR